MRFAPTLFATLVVFQAWAAPPLNLAGDPKATPHRDKPLTQDDLVYTDNVKPDEQVLKSTARIVYSVTGRSLPSRAGKSLWDFQPNDLVKVLRESKDKHWIAVETFQEVGTKKKKAWVPKAALKLPPPAADASPAPGGVGEKPLKEKKDLLPEASSAPEFPPPSP